MESGKENAESDIDFSQTEVAAEVEEAGEIGLEFVGEVKPERGETKIVA